MYRYVAWAWIKFKCIVYFGTNTSFLIILLVMFRFYPAIIQQLYCTRNLKETQNT